MEYTGKQYDPAGQQIAEQQHRRDASAGKAISEVGEQSAAGLACPKCGGAQFKAKRSAAGKFAGGLLAPKSRVKCVTCGTEYRRG